MGHHSGVTTLGEVSSITTLLNELSERVTALAEHAHESGDDDTAFELFAVERSLLGAVRRLQRFTGSRT